MELYVFNMDLTLDSARGWSVFAGVLLNNMLFKVYFSEHEYSLLDFHT